MSAPFSLYEPREDSFILAEQVARYAKGQVLDMGTGSGIQAVTAAKQRNVKSVLAIDIQPKVIAHCKTNTTHPKITYRVSDLFMNVQGKFDTITFNPPYLPDDPAVKDIALDGGKHGSEILERFLRAAPEFLTPDGQILIVFSSAAPIERIHAAIADALLEYQQLASQRHFFEELIVYRIRKLKFRQQLDALKITEIAKLTQGHRGMIYTGMLRKRKVAIKVQRPDSPAKGTVDHEAIVLKQLNKNRIGPKLIVVKKGFFVYEYIEGDFIVPWVEKSSRKAIQNMLRGVLQQMRILDTLKITKQEMHHPHKHIIVDRRGKPWLVDFERARKTEKPKNVTQFCQYLRSGNFNALLAKKGIRLSVVQLTKAAQEYGRNPTIKTYRVIENLLR